MISLIQWVKKIRKRGGYWELELTINGQNLLWNQCSHALEKYQCYLLALFTLRVTKSLNEIAALHSDILIILAPVCTGMGHRILKYTYIYAIQVITFFHWKVKIMDKTFNNVLKLRYIKTCNAWIHRVKPMCKWAVKTIDTWIRFDLLSDNRLSASETNTHSRINDLNYQDSIHSSAFLFTEKLIIPTFFFSLSDLGMFILISRKKLKLHKVLYKI